MLRLPQLRSIGFLCLVAIALVSTTGCAKWYYDVREKLGSPKREILVDRLESANESQEKAQEQFQSALEQFTAMVGYDGGKLEAQYKKMESEFERSESRAKDVRERIASVRSVGKALFAEWEKELDQYTNPELRRISERSLRDSQLQYDRTQAAMDRAADSMDPVLAVFRDQVLFLKHNLNAQALASLQGVSAEMERDVASLIAEMQAAIAESNAFIEQMKAGE